MVRANGTSWRTTHTAIATTPSTTATSTTSPIGPIYQIAAGTSHLRVRLLGRQRRRAVRALTGNNWKIHGNTFHDASGCVLVRQRQRRDTSIYDNNIYNFDHGWSSRWGHHTAPVLLRQHVPDWGSGTRAITANCHHDGLHCFAVAGVGGLRWQLYLRQRFRQAPWARNRPVGSIWSRTPSSSARTPPRSGTSSTTFSLIHPIKCRRIPSDGRGRHGPHTWLYNNTLPGSGAATSARNEPPALTPASTS